jgi:hypothetical protein
VTPPFPDLLCQHPQSPIFKSDIDDLSALKIIQAIPQHLTPINETEVNQFLQSKLNLQVATIDEEGYPMIQPTWFHYDKKSAQDSD